MPDKLDTPTTRSLAFGAFTIDVARSVLLRDGQPLPLRRQSFDVLLHLIDARGRVVGSDELLEAFWAGRPAQPQASVVQCIKDIRGILGDDARWMIRTVPGKGYEFKADIRPLAAQEDPATSAPMPSVAASEQAGSSRTLTASPVAAQRATGWLGAFRHSRLGLLAAATGVLLVALAVGISLKSVQRPIDKEAANSRSQPIPVMTMMASPSLVILPFVSQALAPDAIGIAMADEIRSELQVTPRGFDITIKASDLAVGRAPVATLAQKLDVRYAVAGTMRDEGAQRVVVAQLIEAASGLQLWAEQFSYTLQEPGAFNRLAAQIARQLAVQIRKEENKRPFPQIVEAGHLNIQARVILESQRDEAVTQRAKALYDQAVAFDGNNVQSLMGYARTRVDIVGNAWHGPGERAQILAEADQAIEHALRIDPRSSGAHLLRGVLARMNGNFDRAVASFEHVCDLNPNYVHAYGELGRTKIEIGRSSESIAHIERAFLLSPKDPVASFWAFWAGMAAAHAGDFSASIKWMLKSQQINSEYKRPLLWLAIAYARTGEERKAREALDEYSKSFPKFSLDTWRRTIPTRDGAVAKQREVLVSTLRALGVPEGS